MVVQNEITIKGNQYDKPTIYSKSLNLPQYSQPKQKSIEIKEKEKKSQNNNSITCNVQTNGSF